MSEAYSNGAGICRTARKGRSIRPKGRKEFNQLESYEIDDELFRGFIAEIRGVETRLASNESELMSGDNPVDSVALVEICVRLEDYASGLGFVFDWTSEDAMSRSRSIFRTVGTLYNEFARQMDESTE